MGIFFHLCVVLLFGAGRPFFFTDCIALLACLPVFFQSSPVSQHLQQQQRRRPFPPTTKAIDDVIACFLLSHVITLEGRAGAGVGGLSIIYHFIVS